MQNRQTEMENRQYFIIFKIYIFTFACFSNNKYFDFDFATASIPSTNYPQNALKGTISRQQFP